LADDKHPDVEFEQFYQSADICRDFYGASLYALYQTLPDEEKRVLSQSLSAWAGIRLF